MAIKHGDPDAPLAKEVPSTDYWKLERIPWNDFVNCFTVHVLKKKKERKRENLLIEHLRELFIPQTHSSYSYLNALIFAIFLGVHFQQLEHSISLLEAKL